LKSAATINPGVKPALKVACVAAKPPAPLPYKTLTLPLATTATSWLPSPLKSPAVIDRGEAGTVIGLAVEKTPLPLLSRTLTVLSPLLVTTRSGKPSLLRSTATTPEGLLPTA